MKPKANPNSEYLPFSAPSFGPEEREELLATLDSDWITTGPRTRRLEEEFADYIGSRHAVAVNSCTAALHLALATLGVSHGDAVITTPFTFAATANVIVHCGAQPVFVDIEPRTQNLDPEKLVRFLQHECCYESRKKRLLVRKSGNCVRAIIPVHYGGAPCDMDVISELASRFGLTVIEDAAHAAGAEYQGKKVGALGNTACFSFYANKNMTTAEGGMLTTDDDDIAERTRLLSLHGISRDAWMRYSREGSWRYDLLDAGYKYNMPDLAAALGLHQLRKLDSFIQRRRHLAGLYDNALAGLEEIQLPSVPADRRSACHLYPIQVTAEIGRNELIEELRRRDIGCSVHFIPLHLMTFYQRRFGFKRGDFPIAEQVFERILSLPLFPKMQDEDVGRVAENLRALIERVAMARAS